MESLRTDERCKLWPITKYTLVAWSWPPHDAAIVLARLFDIISHTLESAGTWQIEGEPNRLIPSSVQGWQYLVEQHRYQDDGSLSLFIDSSAGYSVGLTVDYPSTVRIFDVLSVHLPEEHLEADSLLEFDRLLAFFKEVIALFQPFWAWIHDKELFLAEEVASLQFTLDKTKLPDTVHWFNYFSTETVVRLGGTEVLTTSPAYLVQEVSEPPGIVSVLQHEPFDYSRPEHKRRHREVVSQLEFSSPTDHLPSE